MFECGVDCFKCHCCADYLDLIPVVMFLEMLGACGSRREGLSRVAERRPRARSSGAERHKS